MPHATHPPWYFPTNTAFWSFALVLTFASMPVRRVHGIGKLGRRPASRRILRFFAPPCVVSAGGGRLPRDTGRAPLHNHSSPPLHYTTFSQGTPGYDLASPASTAVGPSTPNQKATVASALAFFVLLWLDVRCPSGAGHIQTRFARWRGNQDHGARSPPAW